MSTDPTQRDVLAKMIAQDRQDDLSAEPDDYDFIEADRHVAALSAAGFAIVADGQAWKDGQVWELEHDANRHHYESTRIQRYPHSLLCDLTTDPFLIADRVEPLSTLTPAVEG